MQQTTQTRSIDRTAPSRRPARLSLALLAALALATPGFAVAPEGDRAADAKPAEAAIELNSATVEQLQLVPGIGPAMANRIVAFREQHGPFRRVEDLVKVRGIGELTFQKIRPHVRVASAG